MEKGSWLKKYLKERRYRFSIFAAIILLFSFILIAGCGNSDSNKTTPSGETADETTQEDTNANETTTPTIEPLTDAELFAFQDGDGPWEVMEIPESSIFTPTVTDSQGRYGIAFLEADAEEQELTIETIQTTIEELPQVPIPNKYNKNNEIEFDVSVKKPQNMEASEVCLFFRDDYTSMSFSSDSINYSRTLSTQPGTFDLIVTQAAPEDNYPTNYIARLGIELDTDTPVEETISADDFDNSSAFSVPYTITVQGDSGAIDTASYNGYVQMVTPNLTKVELGNNAYSDASLQYSAPVTPLGTDDIYMATLGIAVDDDTFVEYYEAFQDIGDKTITPVIETFDAVFEADTSTGNLLPGIADIPETGAGTVISHIFGFVGSIDGIEYRTYSIVTSGRRQNETSLLMPDLSSLDGWMDNWSIPPDITTDYTAAGVQYASGMGFSDILIWDTAEMIRPEDGQWFVTLLKDVTYNSGE